MSTQHYLRLRQICLVTRELARTEEILANVLGLSVAFRDERTAHYGLQNIVLPLGTSFIEVVAPLKPGTAAGRFLDRHHGRRGYMNIFDCSDVTAVRARVERLGIRILHSREWPRYTNIQLHPRDTGATMFEFHHNIGGDPLDGYYEPAGEHWRQHVRSNVSVAVHGIEYRAEDPLALAQRWMYLFEKPIRRNAQGIVEIELDNALLRFVEGNDSEHLHAVTISVRDIDAALKSADRYSLPIRDQSIDLCGVWFRLIRA
jgi:catechol 2,3-dioxygenase-like lactoylglutathione lyase family enzyme